MGSEMCIRDSCCTLPLLDYSGTQNDKSVVYLSGLRIFPNVQTDLLLELLLLIQYELLGYYVLHDHILVLFPVHQKPDESMLLLAGGSLHSQPVKTLATLEMAQLKT